MSQQFHSSPMMLGGNPRVRQRRILSLAAEARRRSDQQIEIDPGFLHGPGESKERLRIARATAMLAEQMAKDPCTLDASEARMLVRQVSKARKTLLRHSSPIVGGLALCALPAFGVLVLFALSLWLL